MADAQCPACKTDSYLNPELVLYVSPCFHKLCGNCLNRYFASGKSKCLECGIELRKVNYITSTFEDIEVEKECKIRRQLDRHFNKKEDEFDDQEAYDDYLERLEDLVYELCDLKNETQIKNRINEVLSDEKDILNYKKVFEEVREPSKQKLDIPNPTPYLYEFKKEIVMVNGALQPSRSGGLSKQYILSYLLSILN